MAVVSLPRRPRVDAAIALETELTLARMYVAQHAERLRYDVDAGHWYRCTAGIWRADVAEHTLREIGEFCGEQASDGSAADARRARKWATAIGVAAFVRRDPLIAVRHTEFDAAPHLLGVVGGIIDLRSGDLLEPDPALMVSRCCRVGLAPRGMRPRRWLRALLVMFAGDRSLVRYLQRLFGYALLGERPDHVVVMVYGGGGNGKTTVVETVAWILGDYAAASAAESFIEQHGERHPTDLARLAGVRLVTAAENSAARRLDVALLKRLTGGDTIAARYMRQDYFEFRPQFLPVLVGNHRPRLPSVDDGIARRLHFVEHRVRIADPDPHLPAALRAEGPAILRWLVDGCLAYQRAGLRPPDAVRAATRAYLAEQDVVGQWLADDVIVDAAADELLQRLVARYLAWARPLGAPELSGRALADELDRRGYLGRRTRRGKVVRGLRLVERDLLDA